MSMYCKVQYIHVHVPCQLYCKVRYTCTITTMSMYYKVHVHYFRTLYYKYITPTLHVLPDMDNDSWLVCLYTTQR